jgi:hypothetical protein
MPKGLYNNNFWEFMENFESYSGGILIKKLNLVFKKYKNDPEKAILFSKRFSKKDPYFFLHNSELFKEAI